MLYVTRHGETEWNTIPKMLGHTDIPLNSTGLNQIETAAEQLKDVHLDVVYCSPLTRTRQTAEAIMKYHDAPIIYDERVIERYYGEFEAHKRTEFAYYDFWDYRLNLHFQRAENVQDFFRRIYSFLDDIKEKHKGQNVLIVTHGGVSIPIECYFRGNIPEGPLAGTGLSLKNCQIRQYDI